MPVIKNASTGQYLACLSDTSIDRDDEGMSKELIYSWSKYSSIKALANHDNKMQSWVGGWKNLSAKEKGRHYALFAEPWFFSKEANPLADQIKKQVDEALEKGENPGISVGAIVHDYEMRKVNGEEKRIFTKGELLEATWVPIQSNRNASFGHIAKGFDIENLYKNSEEKKMEQEITQKDIDSAVQKKSEELEKEFKEQLDVSKAKVAELEKSLEDSKSELEKSKKSVEDLTKTIEESKTEIEKVKKEALEKQKFADQGGEEGDGETQEDVDKAFSAGKIPIL
jgi:archaellum component FlaC